MEEQWDFLINKSEKSMHFFDQINGQFRTDFSHTKDKVLSREFFDHLDGLDYKSAIYNYLVKFLIEVKVGNALNGEPALWLEDKRAISEIFDHNNLTNQVSRLRNETGLKFPAFKLTNKSLWLNIFTLLGIAALAMFLIISFWEVALVSLLSFEWGTFLFIAILLPYSFFLILYKRLYFQSEFIGIEQIGHLIDEMVRLNKDEYFSLNYKRLKMELNDYFRT